MHYSITKLYITDANGNKSAGTALLERVKGQRRIITGTIDNHSSPHIAEVRGTGDLCITVAPGTTLHIQPAE